MLFTMITSLKKGTFRWRRKFRHFPKREILIQELGGKEWLANRLLYVLSLHFWKKDNPNHDIQMFRHKWLEHIYIYNKTGHNITLEIIEVDEL